MYFSIWSILWVCVCVCVCISLSLLLVYNVCIKFNIYEIASDPKDQGSGGRCNAVASVSFSVVVIIVFVVSKQMKILFMKNNNDHSFRGKLKIRLALTIFQKKKKIFKKKTWYLQVNPAFLWAKKKVMAIKYLLWLLSFATVPPQHSNPLPMHVECKNLWLAILIPEANSNAN